MKRCIDYEVEGVKTRSRPKITGKEVDGRDLRRKMQWLVAYREV